MAHEDGKIGWIMEKAVILLAGVTQDTRLGYTHTQVENAYLAAEKIWDIAKAEQAERRKQQRDSTP
jgi:hypothetical protein